MSKASKLSNEGVRELGTTERQPLVAALEARARKAQGEGDQVAHAAYSELAVAAGNLKVKARAAYAALKHPDDIALIDQLHAIL